MSSPVRLRWRAIPFVRSLPGDAGGTESLGKPAERWRGPNAKEGSDAVKRIEWQSVPAGTHRVRIEYRRPGEDKPPLETFTVTLRGT